MFPFVSALLAVAFSVDILLEQGAFQPTGELVDVTLSFTIADLDVGTATRTEEPSDDPETDDEAERRVNDVWLFQYSEDGEKLLYYEYVTIDEDDVLGERLTNVPAQLEKLTQATTCIIYAVANTGDNTWVTSSNADSEFGTVELLKAHNIPNYVPIYATELESNTSLGIPMSGCVEGALVWSGCKITVPVERMMAKLMIKVNVQTDESIEASLTSLEVASVPNVCLVGSLYEDQSTAAAEYPSATGYYPWSFTEGQILTPATGDESDDFYPYVIYVPENIKGESDAEEEDGNGKADKAPENSLYVTSYLKLVDENDALIVAEPHYTVYPGGNTTNNYNVRRNCVYRVAVDISPKDVVTPSANCLIAVPGATIAFYPYERDEVWHSDDAPDHQKQNYYDFEGHLNPTDQDLTLDRVDIIWQTQGAIGDNSKGDLVWLAKAEGDSYEDLIHTKIYVKAATAGNALIGGYSSSGQILWSWHIWITNTHPDDVSNAITYRSYLWDENGIYSNTRVTGLPVMNCNLGALSTDVGSDFTQTYGTLYQWGRKDPFPPVKTSSKKEGIYNYDNDTGNVYVYDNSNKLIDLKNNTGAHNATEGNDVFNTVLTDDSKITQTQAGGLEYSIQHPTTFIASAVALIYDVPSETYTYNNLSNYRNQGDWLPGGDDDLWGGNDVDNSTKKYQPYNNLNSSDSNERFIASIADNYGEHKTIFDPCPYGWRTAPGDMWLGFTINGLNWYSYSNATNMDALLSANVNCSETTTGAVASNRGFHMYMNGWKSGDVSFFPTQGSRLASGQPFHGGICGNYHNATVDETVDVLDDGSVVEKAIRRVDILHFHNLGDQGYTQVNTFEKELIYYNRAVAGPVRCVRDTER